MIKIIIPAVIFIIMVGFFLIFPNVGTNRRPSALNCKKWKLVLGKHMDVFDTSEKDYFTIHYIPKNGFRWHKFSEKSGSGGSFTPLFISEENAFSRIKKSEYLYSRFKKDSYAPLIR